MIEDLPGEKVVIDPSKIFGFQKNKKNLILKKSAPATYEAFDNNVIASDSSLRKIQAMRTDVDKEIGQIQAIKELMADFFEVSENHLSQIRRNLDDQEKLIKELLKKVNG